MTLEAQRAKPAHSGKLVVSWGELLWDLFPSGPCLGGAPSNFAVHLAALGQEVSLVTRLGKDELGQRAVQELQTRDVDLSQLQWDEAESTGRVGVSLNKGEASYTLHPGAWRHLECPEDCADLLGRSSAFYFGTLAQESEKGLKAWRRAIQLLPEDCIRFCDPNLRGGRIQAELTLEHMRASDVVKLSDDEAQTFESCYGCKSAPEWLIENLGVKLVLQTHGPDGASLYSQDRLVHHQGFSAEGGGDNVGAGDSFCAVTLLGLLKNRSLPIILKAANRYASFVASNKGATPKPPEQIRHEMHCLLDAE